jgi:nucleotide-binding universal stress UspA family protein
MYQVYLDHVADGMRHRMSKARPKRILPAVQTIVAEGEPAGAICDCVKMKGVTAIVMAAFGGSGSRTWQLGSVADKVVRTTSVPVLLVRGKNTSHPADRKKLISRILVPLDGSDASKLAIPYAMEMAGKFEASITLFGMVERADYYSQHVSFIPYTERMAKEYARLDVTSERNARAYLIGVEKELRAQGVRVTHAITLGLSPARDIMEQEAQTNADLVVMATRGSSGINHWAFGSVTEKVLRGGRLPLFLVREAVPDTFIPHFAGSYTPHLRSSEYGALTAPSSIR